MTAGVQVAVRGLVRTGLAPRSLQGGFYLLVDTLIKKPRSLLFYSQVFSRIGRQSIRPHLSHGKTRVPEARGIISDQGGLGRWRREIGPDRPLFQEFPHE